MSNLALIYTRVSTEEQARSGLSIDSQEQVVRAYCEMRGYRVGATFREQGESGAKPLAARPSGSHLVGMLDQLREPAVVVVSRLDRIFRSAKDCLETVEAWLERGHTLHVVDMGGNSVDFSSPLGKMMLTMTVAFAEFERDLGRQRTRDAMRQLKQNGRTLGRPPIGWRWNRDRTAHIPDPRMTETLRVLVELAAEAPVGSVARTLNSAGYRTQMNKPWNEQTVRKALRALRDGRTPG